MCASSGEAAWGADAAVPQDECRAARERSAAGPSESLRGGHWTGRGARQGLGAAGTGRAGERAVPAPSGAAAQCRQLRREGRGGQKSQGAAGEEALGFSRDKGSIQELNPYVGNPG